MAIVLWPYNIGSKRLIMEDALNSQRDIIFYNRSGDFELIRDGSQIFFPSLDHFKEIIKKEDMHLLCPDLNACRKLELMLKKNKVKFVSKKESYTF